MDDEPRIKVSDNTEINDVRSAAQFKGITLSNFKKTDVRKQLVLNMQKGRVEPSCYWAAELICSGHYGELWETILDYVGKHIHLGNPKMVSYLEKRYNIFRNIMSEGQYTNELQLRNHPTIRNLFAEVISILTLSNKKNCIETIKINRIEEFDMVQISEKLIAPHMNFIGEIFKPDDPKELYIAVNELAYNVSKEKQNMLNACYWIEWILDFETICKKKKTPCLCEARDTPSENKYRQDTIWLIWDIFFHYSNEMQNPFIEQLIQSLYRLFCIKYTTAACKRRRHLLYFAVSLLTEHVPTNISITADKNIIQNVINHIHLIYKQIKKNEESPNTDYLFANLERENTFEQSMRKMEMVNNMDFMTRSG